MPTTWGWYCHRHSLWLATEAEMLAHVNGILTQTHYVTGARKIDGTLP